MTVTPITGNTWPVRVELHEMGGAWDDFRRAWLVPADKADAARALVAAQPAKRSSLAQRRGYRIALGRTRGERTI